MSLVETQKLRNNKITAKEYVFSANWNDHFFSVWMPAGSGRDKCFCKVHSYSTGLLEWAELMFQIEWRFKRPSRKCFNFTWHEKIKIKCSREYKIAQSRVSNYPISFVNWDVLKFWLQSFSCLISDCWRDNSFNQNSTIIALFLQVHTWSPFFITEVKLARVECLRGEQCSTGNNEKNRVGQAQQKSNFLDTWAANKLGKI